MLARADVDVSEAMRFFNRHSVEATFLVPTEIGLRKSILDATYPVRLFLRDRGIHDYHGQKQGEEGKRIVNAYFVTANALTPIRASLYRPKAKGKDGDPRIWFSKLGTYARAFNLLALIVFKGELYVVNMSAPSLIETALRKDSPLGALLADVGAVSSSVVNELLSKLRIISGRGWVPSVSSGDTGIGATLEALLGIETNSRRSPDYKGIEIKAKRLSARRSRNRNTLFAQVPDWDISALKSSEAILDKYGYLRGDTKKLNCTVSAATVNSQGLTLTVDEPTDTLRELHCTGSEATDVVSWRFEVLRNRLLTKHNETFWVGADCANHAGTEHFHYLNVIHTRSPFATNFHTLCAEGIVTVDHLIKRDRRNRVSERGPLFKIRQENFDLLFPPSSHYSLAAER